MVSLFSAKPRPISPLAGPYYTIFSCVFHHNIFSAIGAHALHPAHSVGSRVPRDRRLEREFFAERLAVLAVGMLDVRVGDHAIDCGGVAFRVGERGEAVEVYTKRDKRLLDISSAPPRR